MFHAAVAALNAGPLDLAGHLRNLSCDLGEVVERRPFGKRTDMHHASPESLPVLGDKPSFPENDACQQRHDWQETVQAIQIGLADCTNEKTTQLRFPLVPVLGWIDAKGHMCHSRESAGAPLAVADPCCNRPQLEPPDSRPGK